MNLLKCISHRSYEEILKHLGLPTLEYRRARTDLVQVYKIIKVIKLILADYLHSHRTSCSPGSKRRKKWPRSTQRITAISLFYQ